METVILISMYIQLVSCTIKTERKDKFLNDLGNLFNEIIVPIEKDQIRLKYLKLFTKTTLLNRNKLKISRN